MTMRRFLPLLIALLLFVAACDWIEPDPEPEPAEPEPTTETERP